MDKREDALLKALETNEQEQQRWTQYVADNEIALQNLDMFSKHLEVEVMVPVGRKMLMFGHLRHTNEVLVGQFQGYFSKCSAHQAKEICNKRIEYAHEHLKKLQQEESLWQNNLELPYKEGTFASAAQEEIIEEYNEEQEKRWREKHKTSVQQQKMLEKAAREHDISTCDKDVYEILQERELMEELEQELETLAIDATSAETVRKLLDGEMPVPNEKTRIAHNKASSVAKADVAAKQAQNVEKENELVPSDDDDDFEEEDEELRTIRLELGLLSSSAQKAHLEHRLKIVRNKMTELKMCTPKDVEEKTRLYCLHDELQEMLDLIDDTPAQSVAAQEKNLQNLSKKNQKRISFALNDDTLEFRRNETVAEMLPKTAKDVIKLGKPPVKHKTVAETANVDKKKIINERVAQSMQFMHDNQSQQDFSLVDKIIGKPLPYPFLIKFEHSPNAGYVPNKILSDTPMAPADFYARYLQQKLNKPDSSVIYVDAFEGEVDTHVPILREEKHAAAYKSNISEFSKPAADNTQKSILCNKAAVKLETHLPENEEPQNYVDTHAPKKRISNFRKMREAQKVEKEQHNV